MISNFFINRPIVAMVISIITLLGGFIAMLGLPLAQFPEIVPPQIIVSTTYTGADAITIEQSLSTPLEQQMNGVDNMLYMQSTNANDGTEQLFVTFDVATDVNIDQVNVQNRIAQAQPNLPSDVIQYGITTRKSTGLPMLVISLYSPKRTYDSLFLANYANINVNDVLYRVPGVGQVTELGGCVSRRGRGRVEVDVGHGVERSGRAAPESTPGAAPGVAVLRQSLRRIETPTGIRWAFGLSCRAEPGAVVIELDRAATRAGRAGDHVHDDDRDDRADGRHDDRADVERAVDRVRVEQDTGEEAADEGADDAEDDVADDPKALVTADEEAGQIAGNGAENDPSNDAHEEPPSLSS